MSYRVFARQYRPKKFDEVIGQHHVTKTLAYALLKKNFAQAYLFSGPRGVGKTTVARVFAKTLNCKTKGPANACGTCPACLALDQGSFLDYEEIDGASYRGIDQIREIGEKLQYVSVSGLYRVFVIDEVHMLTQEAFNAMLKFLEEPPAHVVFILCTTESMKIPLTVRSRCQHFRFKLLEIDKIIGQLQNICHKENLKVDDDALMTLARHATGSLRDAENMLEQALAYSGGSSLSGKTARSALSESELSVKLDFMRNLKDEKLAANLTLIHQLEKDGFSFSIFLHELVLMLSAFVYLKAGIQERFTLELSKEEFVAYKELLSFFSLGDIYRLQDILFQFIQEIKNSTETRTLTLLSLIKLSRYKKLITAEEIRENLLFFSKMTAMGEPSHIPPSSVPAESPQHASTQHASSEILQKNTSASASTLAPKMPATDSDSTQKNMSLKSIRKQWNQPQQASQTPSKNEYFSEIDKHVSKVFGDSKIVR